MAAVAAAAVLGLLEPHMTSPGGDIFTLFYDSKSQTVKGINGSGRSPQNLSYDQLVKDLNSINNKNTSGIPGIPATHVHSVTVPGAVAGWIDTVDTFGNGKLSLAQILEPAIRLAREGAPVPEVSAGLWKAGIKKLVAVERAGSDNTDGGNALLLPTDNGSQEDKFRAPEPGESYVNEDLAKVYEKIAKEGKAGFYKGEVADKIVEAVKARGGYLTHEDLAAHESTILDSDDAPPISTTWKVPGSAKTLRVHEIPPNGQGIVALQTLAILQALEKSGKLGQSLGSYTHNSTEYLHLLIESLKSSFRDVGSRVISDLSAASNKNVPAPETFLTEEYINAQLQNSTTSNIKFDASKASENVAYLGSKSDTVYLTATDQWGNACSFINSVYGLFGSGIVPRESGFVLQNRGGNFNLIKGSVNVYEPGKRPYHTIIPAMVTVDHSEGKKGLKTGDLYMTYGVMGGFMQPQGHVQVLLNLTLFGFNEQEALDAPRICLMSRDDEPQSGAFPQGGTPGGPTTTKTTVVAIEKGIPEETIEGLKALGHEIVVLEGDQRSLFGRGQVVRYNARKDTKYSAGSDPRGDGAALPQVF